jgi:hypothetical protein
VFVIFGEHSIFKANPSFDASLCNTAKTLSARNQSSAISGYGGFLHLANELSISSFGFEGYFVSNFYPVSVVSQTTCIVAKADCRLLLSSIQNIDFIDILRKAALLRTQWLAMRSHQAVQVLGLTPASHGGIVNNSQNARMSNWLGSQVESKGQYRKALMSKDDYAAIASRWRDAREVLQKKRLQKFLSNEKPSPKVASLYASSVQSSVLLLKQVQKTKVLLDATQIHVTHRANDSPIFREARSKPWIAEATSIMQVRKSMNPPVSAEDMLQTSSCSRIAAQSFSKVTIITRELCMAGNSNELSAHSYVCVILFSLKVVPLTTGYLASVGALYTKGTNGNNKTLGAGALPETADPVRFTTRRIF